MDILTKGLRKFNEKLGNIIDEEELKKIKDEIEKTMKQILIEMNDENEIFEAVKAVLTLIEVSEFFDDDSTNLAEILGDDNIKKFIQEMKKDLKLENDNDENFDLNKIVEEIASSNNPFFQQQFDEYEEDISISEGLEAISNFLIEYYGIPVSMAYFNFLLKNVNDEDITMRMLKTATEMIEILETEDVLMKYLDNKEKEIVSKKLTKKLNELEDEIFDMIENELISFLIEIDEIEEDEEDEAIELIETFKTIEWKQPFCNCEMSIDGEILDNKNCPVHRSKKRS